MVQNASITLQSSYKQIVNKKKLGSEGSFLFFWVLRHFRCKLLGFKRNEFDIK